MTPDYKPLIIAGQNSGTPVQLNRVYAQFYNNLEPMARAGNYWANLIIKELQSLSSGHIKRNVFVSNTPKNANFTHFQMLLPGCRAYVLKCSSGKYLVYKMKLDEKYPMLQAEGRRPGLYHVSKSENHWMPKFKESGEVTKSSYPLVSISDGQSKLTYAANDCANHIGKSSMIGSLPLQREGFDMHYTPGEAIGGLKQINQALYAATAPSLRESAQLLAYTMEKAKDTQGVLWLTQAGGLGVMTQAMHILRSKGVHFNDSDHHIHFSHPTTSYIKAQQLAIELGMKFDRDNTCIHPLNLDELVGGMNLFGDYIAGYQRMKQDPEYSAMNFGVDSLKGVSRNWQAISIASGCTAAISAALGSGGSAIAIPAVITAATATAGLGKTLFQQWLPEKYRRLTSKL